MKIFLPLSLAPVTVFDLLGKLWFFFCNLPITSILAEPKITLIVNKKKILPWSNIIQNTVNLPVRYSLRRQFTIILTLYIAVGNYSHVKPLVSALQLNGVLTYIFEKNHLIPSYHS